MGCWRAGWAEEGRTPDESLRLAQSAAEAGDVEGARQIITEAFGAEALELPEARAPRITQSLLRVENARGTRALRFDLVDATGGEAAAKLIRETAAALGDAAPLVAAGPALTITLRYDEPADLMAAQSRIAAALPDLPELALLRSALATRHLAWPLTPGPISLESGYQERVDLGESVRVWDGEAAKLEAAAAQAEATGEPLDQVRAAVWRGDARLWRDISGLSRAVYRVQVDEHGAGPDWLVARAREFYQEGSLSREWSVRAGETRQLEASILGWRYDRVALAGALAILVVLTVFVGAALIVR